MGHKNKYAAKFSPYKFTRVPKKHDASAPRKQRKMDETMLSDEQRTVFGRICRWYSAHAVERSMGPVDTRCGLLTLGGFAGTGKSTLVSLLASRFASHSIGFCAFTGKAASVLRRKLNDTGVYQEDHTVSTLHRLLYIPVVDEENGRVTGWRPRDKPDLDLIVVDEASMVDQRVYDGLSSFDIPLLAVGDHGQLPPVFGGKFNLMEAPDLRLETIHRQAKDSPILALSEEVRRTGAVNPKRASGHDVQVVPMRELPQVMSGLFSRQGGGYNDVAVLVNTNRERIYLNELARRALWGSAYKEELMVGDQIICLKNTEGSIFNGMRGVVTHLDKKYETILHYYGRVLFEDDEIEVEGPICRAQFNRETTIRDFDEFAALTGHRINSWDGMGLLCDYGYALTVHKAQGSQFTYAVVVNRPTSFMDFDTKKRALYTAVTRCSNYLIVVQE